MAPSEGQMVTTMEDILGHFWRPAAKTKNVREFCYDVRRHEVQTVPHATLAVTTLVF